MKAALKSRVELELDRLALDPYCKFYLPLWKLDGDSFMSKDAYGHLCTNYGSIWTPQGRSFDGVDDYVDCGNKPSLDITDAITVEAWVRPSSDPDAYSHLVAKGHTEAYNLQWEASTANNPILFLIKPVGESYVTTDMVGSLSINIWAQLVGTYDSATGLLKLHQDGKLLTTKSIGAGKKIDTTTTSLKIADDGSPGGFPGLIGEVRIYNHALTPQEILDHYIIGKEMFG